MQGKLDTLYIIGDTGTSDLPTAASPAMRRVGVGVHSQGFLISTMLKIESFDE